MFDCQVATISNFYVLWPLESWESCHINYCKTYLFLFLGELAPATAFMTGKVKVSGDLSKALTLEKVMKATREAAEANRNKQGWSVCYVMPYAYNKSHNLHKHKISSVFLFSSSCLHTTFKQIGF